MYPIGYNGLVLEVREYIHNNKRAPFTDWLGALDRKVRARIDARIDRLILGNFGDCKSVGDGVSELRIDFGPGYRVYFGRDGKTIVLLLCGGDKSTQQADINAQSGIGRFTRVTNLELANEISKLSGSPKGEA